MTNGEPLLSVRELKTHFPVTEGFLRREVDRVRAVDGVSFDVHRGEAFGLVGESGCGKSTTALTILGLEEPTSGEIRFGGLDVSNFDARQRRDFRRRVQLVLQDPASAFNPRLTVGEAVEEPLEIHGVPDADRRRRIARDALERVGLDAEDATKYPHEFSGGEKQRIALARVLVVNPDLIIADEPTSALDGRTKANVLRLMTQLQADYGLAMVFISHDIDLIERVCDRIGVMYLGTLVERGPTDRIIESPHHPYTRTLISSVPTLDPTAASTRPEAPVHDPLPDAANVPSGCRFHPRCPAIIPPDGIELPDDDWRGLVSLRLAIEEDGQAVVNRHLRGGGRDGTHRPDLRDAYGLSDPLADGTCEGALIDAVAHLERGDIDAAIDTLSTVTIGVCERASPSLVDDHTPWSVACHRYDPTVPGEPIVEVGTETRDG